MANNKNVWAVGSKEGWAVKREGASRASSSYRTQTEAWSAAQRMAKESRGDAILQGLSGQIRERSSYGNSPKKTKC